VSNELLIGILMALAVIAVAAGAMAAYVRVRTPGAASPETNQPAVVDAEATHSAAKWKEGHQHPTAATRKTAFKAMARWYAGKRCAICGRDIAPLSHFGPEPGLMGAASPNVTVAWTDVPADQLPTMLETHLPVCSSCHLMTWFQHEHPDLVVDRHRTQETDTIVH
jgi:hypothetical protein